MDADRPITPAQLVQIAIGRFSAGDDEGFIECFHADATIWSDPQLAPGVVLSGRDDVAAWCDGAYVELDVLTTNGGAGGAWRLFIAVFVRDGLVIEVLPQPDRATAVEVLTTR
jgi:hypothetical protein